MYARKYGNKENGEVRNDACFVLCAFQDLTGCRLKAAGFLLPAAVGGGRQAFLIIE